MRPARPIEGSTKPRAWRLEKTGRRWSQVLCRGPCLGRTGCVRETTPERQNAQKADRGPRPRWWFTAHLVPSRVPTGTAPVPPVAHQSHTRMPRSRGSMAAPPGPHHRPAASDRTHPRCAGPPGHGGSRVDAPVAAPRGCPPGCAPPRPRLGGMRGCASDSRPRSGAPSTRGIEARVDVALICGDLFDSNAQSRPGGRGGRARAAPADGAEHPGRAHPG